MLTALQAQADAAGRIIWDVSENSSIARAHQHAVGARKKRICKQSRQVGFEQSRLTTR
jgi:hypothetical protein